jgi:hypothetical protein
MVCGVTLPARLIHIAANPFGCGVFVSVRAHGLPSSIHALFQRVATDDREPAATLGSLLVST